MQKETIHQLIADRNKEMERAALRNAEDIIKEIVGCQERIENAQKRIDELRKELRELEIKKLDAKTILGQE